MSHAGIGLREEPLYQGTLRAWDLGIQRSTPPKSMRLPTGTQLLRRLPHPHTRSKNSPETQDEGLHPLPRYQSRLRQCQHLHPQSEPLSLPRALLHGRLGLLLPVGKDLHPAVPRIPQPLLPGLSRQPPGVPNLPPAFSFICFSPTHVDPQRTYVLLRGRFFDHSSLPFPQRQHPQTTKTLQYSRRKGPRHRRVLLGPKN